MNDEAIEIATERKRSRIKPPTSMEINMTAMIDVLFMLMLFLLLGTRFGAREGLLLSRMPQLSGEPPKIVTPTILITLDEDNQGPFATVKVGELENDQIRLHVEPTQGDRDDTRQFNDEQLYKQLRAASRSGGAASNITVRIEPGSNVQWNYALQVYNTAWRAGFREIRWTLRRPAGPPR